jgi:peptidoglycan LD-endopeptidase CwlK
MMNLLLICKDVEELNPLVKALYEMAIKEIMELGINPCLVETYRPQERQNYLYCQGRASEDCIKKGINRDFALKYANKSSSAVTWTLNSIHAKRKAVDLVPQRVVKGKLTAVWNAQDKETLIIIKTMEKYGFEPGANWSVNADSPHFQIDGNFDSVFMQDKNTRYVTKMIQKALNDKVNTLLKIDGIWGSKTTVAVNKFREVNGWVQNGKLGVTALKLLLS